MKPQLASNKRCKCNTGRPGAQRLSPLSGHCGDGLCDLIQPSLGEQDIHAGVPGSDVGKRGLPALASPVRRGAHSHILHTMYGGAMHMRLRALARLVVRAAEASA